MYLVASEDRWLRLYQSSRNYCRNRRVFNNLSLKYRYRNLYPCPWL